MSTLRSSNQFTDPIAGQITEWIIDVSSSVPVAPIEVIKNRPWSLVARIPTADGPLWFKESRAGTRYETYLLEALAGWAPGAVLAPIAVDHSRGWSLLPDGGTTVYEAGGPPDAGQWERILSGHAELQRHLVVRVPDMLAAGVPDQRANRLMAQFDSLIDSYRASVHQGVVDLRPQLERRSAALAASAVPASLQHDDLHGNNVFVTGQVFDWGDSAISHPFTVLLTSLRIAAKQLGVGLNDPSVSRLRDAYLEPWSDLANKAALIDDVDNAVELGKIGRALAWTRALAPSTATAATLTSAAASLETEDFSETVPGWLAQLLEPEYPDAPAHAPVAG